MGFFNEFPHTRTYDIDLGWLIKTVKDLQENLQNFIKLNTVKYADPIQWNITRQYEANTVVIDALTGVAYISIQPVPSGVNINNTDYWTPVFTLDLVNLNKNLTLRNDGDNHNATFPSVIGDWVIVGGQLYKVIQDIGVYTAYVVGYNIEIYSVELFIRDYVQDIINHFTAIIGVLDDLNTSDKTSVVNAINAVLINTINNITIRNDGNNNTATFTSSVGDWLIIGGQLYKVTQNISIGDIYIVDTNIEIYTVELFIKDYINNIITKIGDLDDLNTSDKTSVVNAINSILAVIGDLDDLVTPDKTSVVNAINSTYYYVTPEMYGAVGDGVTDDTNAVQDAIDNCPVHGTVIMSKCYSITTGITINKPCTINGAYNGFDVEEHTDYVTLAEYQKPTIITNTDGFIINSVGVTITNLAIRATGNSTDPLIYYTDLSTINSPTEVARNNTLRNVMLFGNGNTNYGVTCQDDIITSTFDQVRIYSCHNGFQFGNENGKAVTSLLFSNCWVINATNVGYQLINASYCNFVSCACDNALAACVIGYDIEHSKNISIINSGAEGMSLAAARALASASIHFNILGYNINASQSSDGGLIICNESHIFLDCCYVNGDLSLTSNRLVKVIGTYNLSKITAIGCKYRYINVLNYGDVDSPNKDYIGAYHRQVTVTTGNFGEASTGMLYVEVRPISMYSSANNQFITPYKNASDELAFRVTDITGTAVANTSVTVNIDVLSTQQII